MALAATNDGLVILERMVRAVEKVRERLLRATAALEEAKIPYAVIGGNAVAAWVARVDEAAVRNTADVGIMVRRPDLEAVKAAMAGAGFQYHETLGVHRFLDGPAASPRNADIQPRQGPDAFARPVGTRPDRRELAEPISARVGGAAAAPP